MAEPPVVFRAVRAESLPDQIQAQLERAIEEGRLLPGERLPSERTLSTHFGVSRVVIREAVRTLEATGLLEVRSGAGTFVSRSPSESVRAGWSTWLIAHRDEVLELLSVRRAIEQLAASRAAEKATREDVESLQRVCERFEAELDADVAEVERLVELDIEFHHAIAVVGGGRLMPRLVDELAAIMRDSRRATFRQPGRGSATAPDHRRIVDAISRHDTDAASHALSDHLTSVMETVANVTAEPPSVEHSRAESAG